MHTLCIKHYLPVHIIIAVDIQTKGDALHYPTLSN